MSTKHLQNVIIIKFGFVCLFVFQVQNATVLSYSFLTTSNIPYDSSNFYSNFEINRKYLGVEHRCINKNIQVYSKCDILFFKNKP